MGAGLFVPGRLVGTLLVGIPEDANQVAGILRLQLIETFPALRTGRGAPDQQVGLVRFENDRGLALVE